MKPTPDNAHELDGGIALLFHFAHHWPPPQPVNNFRKTYTQR